MQKFDHLAEGVNDKTHTYQTGAEYDTDQRIIIITHRKSENDAHDRIDDRKYL